MFESSAKKLRFMKYAVIAHAINVRGKHTFYVTSGRKSNACFILLDKSMCTSERELVCRHYSAETAEQIAPNYSFRREI